ncbi:hypothetical protein ASC61_07540 [Aeromicrobium sp. Root344]|uniref:carboxypeptidase regulatory-like domain-containing protein n=1 Tax=Aeromicrobium sp. Root344 TaxID=1736521 RepID=UPI0006F7EE5C|nr:carboxypeptidase regulatory-like domain-containing protein [Aeromicrobium sp. Root344]KQV74865.1 hypothetical protein ASC61_07540 [Aeromicrobium sp. Root344]
MSFRGSVRWAVASVVFTITAALAGAAWVAPADAATGRVISGRVVDADGKGIPSITVLADWYSSSERQWREDDAAVTDADGNYSVKLGHLGSYKVHFVAYEFLSNQYAPTWYPGVARMADATVLRVSTSSLRHVDVTMKLGGVISGRVLEPDGSPVPTGTSIQAYPATGDPEQVSGDWGSLWTTVQGGSYSFPGLLPGTYRVQASSTQAGAPTWLGQTSYFDTASKVTVALGEQKSDNDITLQVPGTMGGRVLHPTTANTRPPVRITLFDRYRHRARSTVTDANGYWSLSDLAPADYRVAYYADNAYLQQWYGPSATQSGSPLFTVKSSATTTVNTRLVYSSMKFVTRPRILGTRKVGKVLEATNGTWNHKPGHFTYRWYRNGTAITGATRKTYTLRSADAGHRLSVRVTAFRGPYEPGSAMSGPTSTIRR